MNLQRSLLVCIEDHFEDVLAMDYLLCEVVIVCLLFEHHSVRWHCPCSVSVWRVVVAIRYEMPDVSRLWNVALPFE